MLRTAGGALLERVDVESDYRGPELPAGTRSVAFRLTFRAPDRTLRDAEVDEVETRLLAALEPRAGHPAAGRRVPHGRVTVAYTYERPDLPALAELERLLDEPRRGAGRPGGAARCKAEAELKEAQASGGVRGRRRSSRRRASG